MAGRTPQTQEKRRREREKQVKRQQKMAKRLERNSKEREPRPEGETKYSAPMVTAEIDPMTGAIIVKPPAATPPPSTPTPPTIARDKP